MGSRGGMNDLWRSGAYSSNFMRLFCRPKKRLGKKFITAHWVRASSLQCIVRWHTVEGRRSLSENLYNPVKTQTQCAHIQTGMKISALFIGLILSLSLYETFPKKCKLQGTTRLPAFSMDGDYIVGGVFSIHNYLYTVEHNFTTMPEPPRCTGRLVRGRSGGYVTITLCENRNVLIFMMCL